ncbi:AER323Wp [Eremothecium gossypii ATCC 10895]|uniref:Mediator of RNA polymerase II transcription subunit 13 n=1 Tax=Eremothecium gossypii (strain ATCC 10895 / CBS 109.51 / FGSC 9923 / NRRL Y-1056) TaxID=284811 RepID=SSN2_EREGS|nr:AER323Wp [Eremothecium gossypii ATCC 10895]Q756F6.1 RecName: Full=Mediator of RNA polymerase II transcription subunit 13; AltName: Full=Mediator complex subunit 13 [Eremothecium gossypii ATCC 10895]AAS53003.1 AER323Wp [Eremothecium gossypii ATCC 10895]AEY97311.1 FAER323Wp [Eremothecium gossypii FDAG1]
MDILETSFRLEDVLSSYYRVEKVVRVNYQQFVPRTPDDQWCIQSELLIRKKDPKALVALFSRELWCFSINDQDLPMPGLEGIGEPPNSEKKGHFTPGFSKPNLPTPYAIFLKALRRMIHINMCLRSQNRLVPFGNTCIFQRDEKASSVIHFDSHLFENGDLTVSLCTKDMGFERLLSGAFTGRQVKRALYLAPSGIRAYLPFPDISKCLVAPPKNAHLLLVTLLVSHGIDLTQAKDLKWIKLVPNINHLNGYTPTISRYAEESQTSKSVIWPMDLCFQQTPADACVNTTRATPLDIGLQDSFDLIEDFIQLKLTSAYRIPGTSVNANTATGNNPLSTGGGFTDQFQPFVKHTNSSSCNYGPASRTKLTPSKAQDLRRSAAPLSADSFGNGFMTTPNVNENMGSVIDDMVICPSSVKSQNDLWNDRKSSNDDIDSINPTSQQGDSARITSGSEEQDVEVTFDKDLFGDEDDESDLFGDSSNKSTHRKEVREITDEMFDSAEIESDPEGKITPTGTSINYSTQQQTPLKRKYLDIPLDEITLPAAPLYTDPGAPLPVETPRDRRKSVFAPLNFNPMIESNVDNKYKNGGKFSFDPNEIDEPLKFEVSTTNISSSEEDDSEFSGDDFDELQQNNLQDIRAMEVGSSLQQYDMGRPINEFLNQSDSAKEDYLLPAYQSGDVIDVDKFPSRESHLDQIWKSPEINREDTPHRIGLPIIKPQLDGSGNLDIDNQITDNCSSNYYEPTPVVGADEKIQERTLHKDKKLDQQGDSAMASVVGDYSLAIKETRESSNGLPFLLRHMPLFSIPDVFLSKNPIVKVDSKLEDFLEILCEQLVFDQGFLGNFDVDPPTYKDVKLNEKGVIRETLNSVFSEFERLRGNEIISDMFYIKQPSVCVKKHGNLIKLKSDAESFAPLLHLKPSRGMKSFRGLFLTTILTQTCVSFITELAHIYSAQELGFCELVKLTNDEHNGLIVLNNFNTDTLLLLSAQIVSYCSTNMNNVKNIPLMIFLPVAPSSLEATITMTSKFQLIKNEVKSRLPDVELLLKLIPFDLTKDPVIMIDRYYELCRGIYNLLPPRTVKFASIADNLPEQVEFRTSAGNQNQLSHYDSYIHLAYTRSIDREWLAAAWSDSKGTENMVKAWYLGNSKARFETACNELWKLTVELASRKYGRICLILTRMDSVLPDDELMHWRRLSVTTRNLHLAVVCVGASTKVSLYDEDQFYPSFKPLFKDKRYANKIQANQLDDYEVVNIDEELHGVVFSSPLQLANSQHRCAIKSGALVRFKRCAGGDTLDKFEVNLLNCPHSDSTKLLKTILHQFRDIASLNTWFCISRGKDNYIPWHVVAVKKIMRFIIHVNGIEEK